MKEKKAVIQVAQILGISIRTAPKCGGVDDIAYEIIDDAQKQMVASEMRKVADLLKQGKPQKVQKSIELDWNSDADTIDKSDCLILIGVKGRKPMGFNCGGCGFASCQDLVKAKVTQSIFMAGPFCMFKHWDLAVAIASAAKAAADFNVDNRMMYKAGVAAYRLGMLKGYNPILGLPLSATGKNIYFDRWEKLEAKRLKE